MQKKNKIFKKIRPEKDIPAGASLSISQKSALAGLGVFALAIFIFWGMELRNNILYPANSGLKPAEKLAVFSGNKCPDGNCAGAEKNFQTEDTDKDGLTDSDELNKYETSPYLEDSDGDGIDDSTEIKNSTDPNCPQGRDCSLTGALAGTGVEATSTLPQAAAGEEDIIKANAAILRQALLDSKSIDKETLDKISDIDLLAIYQTAAEEAAASSSE